jgi:probable O-glycosylation ligase (exosortase A-associated)
MRDILITLLIFGSLPFFFKRPYIGVLVWSWLSYMNPHRLTWSFAYHMPFAQIVAITLFAAILFSKDRRSIPVNATTVVWMVFLLWMAVTTFLAVYPEPALNYYIRILKIQAITALTLMLMTDKRRIDMLIWVIALSIGFYSIKGGVFTVLSGGGYRVWGPASSMIMDNNHLALATLMILPLMYYLYATAKNKWVKYFLQFSIFTSFLAVLGSQSRGALLAIICVIGYFWLGSKTKLLSGLAIVILAFIGFIFMPQSWHDRMNTIENYEQDESAMSRIHAWKYSINIANDRFTGGGLNSWSTATYNVYSPEAPLVIVAHSIYFNVLADHGWLGLLMYLAILALTWNNLSKVVRATAQSDPDTALLARMLKVSFIAYLTGGAFLSLSYFDLPWHIVAIAVLLRTYCIPEKELSKPRYSFRRVDAAKTEQHLAMRKLV